MIKLNENYKTLKDSYLFFHIAQKTKQYVAEHPGTHLYRMGIGDVSLPLADVVISKLHEAVEDQAKKETFHGYMPETGDPDLCADIRAYYRKRGVILKENEAFVSSGASDELGDILDLFDRDNTVLIMEPAYPAYVDANMIAGHRILHLPSGAEDDFTPLPDDDLEADLIYICSPNNPTGAVFTKEKLSAWVSYAKKHGSLILFDAAYEAFIEEDLPHSIYEIEGAKDCAIEISSLSKTAGFTGTRCGYTVIPEGISFGGLNLNKMWVRNRTTKTNGVSYIIQKGARAVFTEEGQKQIRDNINIYKENAKCLMKVFDELKIPYWGGKNAPYIWIRCPKDMGSWEFFDLLLDQIQVVGTPGEGFGKCGEGYFRFSTFGDPEETRIAAERIKALLG